MVVAAGEEVDTAGEAAFAASTVVACWMNRRLPLFPRDRSSSDGLRDSILPAYSPSLAGGETAASPRRVNKAWTVGSAADVGPGASVDWLLAALADAEGNILSLNIFVERIREPTDKRKR